MSQIREIKEATDIIEVIGSRVALQRSGSSLKGLCPFHNEKTPSFFVSEELQRYKCFGCGRNGDVFTFVEEYEGMTFYEVLETLAEQAGIKLEKTTPSGEDKLRTEIMQALDLAKEYYHFLLTKHRVGAKGRQYLKERGTSQQSIKLFQLGVAPDSWDSLIKYLHKKKKYQLEVLEKAGLIIRNRTGRHYDRFRNRIIFPLRNHRGQVVGFSGRALPAADSTKKSSSKSQEVKDAKYINTPETAVYHKSELLYGLSELKQQIRNKKQVVVAEGEFDVISSQQVHVSHVVAIKGSALTSQHVKLLGRTVDQVLLSLDADVAGIEATKKAIKVVNAAEETSQGGLELRVIKLPKGQDPDDLARNEPAAWRELVKQSVTAYEFLIDAAFDQHDVKTPAGKKRIMADLLPELASITHAVELEHYLQTISRRLKVSTGSVQEDLDDYLRRQSSSKVMRVGAKSGSRSVDQVDSKAPEHKILLTKKQSLEQYLWFLLFHSKPVDLHVRAKDLEGLSLELPGSKQILSTISNTLEESSLAEIVKELPNDLQEKVFQMHSSQHLFSGVDKIDIKKEWQSTYEQFRQFSATEDIKQIEVELERLDAVENKSDAQLAEQEGLLRKLVGLRR